MKFIIIKGRPLLCCLILIAFFIPSFENVSGLGYINHAFSEVRKSGEITRTDALITIIPLLLIPFFALIILIRSIRHMNTRKTYLALPFVFLCFFFAILFLTSGSTGSFSSFKVLFQMQIGFYLSAMASLLLVFTKHYKRKRSKRRTEQAPEASTAADVFNPI